jgi:putative sigma-54 modulation protein
MNIQVFLKNLNTEEDISGYAERKISKLSKYLNNINSIKIELSQVKSKSRRLIYTAQVTLNVNGFLIRGEQKAEDVRVAIDAVSGTMERQIEKFKSKYEISKTREAQSIRNPVLTKDKIEFEEYSSNIVKSKHFIIKPMTIEQAIDQMEFLGHKFFLFINAEDDVISVVYLRDDEKYGLIQPEYK